MSDEQSAQERTELPTPRRREKAREEGQVPRSQELTAAIMLLAGASTIALVSGPGIGRQAARALQVAAASLVAEPLTIGSAGALLREMLQSGFLAFAPVLLAVALPGLLIAGLQARGVLSLKPVTPQLSRISPLSGFKRLVSPQSAFTLVKSLLKLAVIGALAWTALRGAWGDLAGLGGEEPGVVVAIVKSLGVRLVALVGFAFLGVAGVDYGFEVWQHEKKLRMTRQEVVQEFRESEGDPLLKSRMKSLAQAMSRKRMLHKVKEADVVVTNPVHVAVALRYDGGSDSAPVVLAMGKRKLAERIKVLAREAGVPIMENPPLARALIATSTVGKAIPPALYAAVAEVLAWVYRRRGRLPAAPTRRTR